MSRRVRHLLLYHGRDLEPFPKVLFLLPSPSFSAPEAPELVGPPGTGLSGCARLEQSTAREPRVPGWKRWDRGRARMIDNGGAKRGRTTDMPSTLTIVRSSSSCLAPHDRWVREGAAGWFGWVGPGRTDVACHFTPVQET